MLRVGSHLQAFVIAYALTDEISIWSYGLSYCIAKTDPNYLALSNLLTALSCRNWITSTLNKDVFLPDTLWADWVSKVKIY